MACTGQFAWHLGEEAEPRGEGAGPWELGAEGQGLSPGFRRWVVIALFNPGLTLDVTYSLGLTLVPNTDQLLSLPLTLEVCVWAGGLAVFSSCPREGGLFPTWWKYHLCNPGLCLSSSQATCGSWSIHSLRNLSWRTPAESSVTNLFLRFPCHTLEILP